MQPTNSMPRFGNCDLRKYCLKLIKENLYLNAYLYQFISANTLNTERACCYAFTAECLSCTAGMELKEYCKQNPDISGCKVGTHFYNQMIDLNLVKITPISKLCYFIPLHA